LSRKVEELKFRMEKFDLIILGGGPSGYAALMRAMDFGKKVCLIEKEKIGGAGIHNGALSSKTLWELSEKYMTTKDMLHSYGHLAFEPNWKNTISISQEVVAQRLSQLVHQITELAKLDERALSVRIGSGKMVSKNEVEITRIGSSEVIWGDNILIATGSSPRKLKGIEVDEKTIITSDGISRIKEFPKSMVILGAGVIGCEFATIFSNFGKTKVFLIDRADRVLPFEDEDISEIVASSLRTNNVVIHNEADFKGMQVVNGQVQYEIQYPKGMTQLIRVEKALISVGRTPNTENIGLENVGVELDSSGNIKNTDGQTTIPNIYAAGDVSGHMALVNVGEIEARHCVERMFSKDFGSLSYDNLCTIMFLHPEVASVGLNEQGCITQGINAKVVKLEFNQIVRALAMQKTQGFFKIIVTDDEEMRILGMRAVGEHASSAIQAVGLLIKMKKGIHELAELVHPHPSIIEGIQECVRILLGKSILRLEAHQKDVQVYRLIDGQKTPILGTLHNMEH
jgi:dihydrolipoamide dehydrogenase